VENEHMATFFRAMAVTLRVSGIFHWGGVDPEAMYNFYLILKILRN